MPKAPCARATAGAPQITALHALPCTDAEWRDGGAERLQVAGARSPDARLGRCFEIARLCLEGDPHREVPALEDELELLSYQQQGRERTEADIADARAAGYQPAFRVADNALALASDLVDEEAAGGQA